MTAGAEPRSDLNPALFSAACTDGEARRLLDHLWRRGAAFLGCELAIMGGAMTWVSERNLVAAISNGGGFGVIACGAMNPTQLDAEIAATRAQTQRPFGVNLITMHPQLAELVDVCAKRGVGHIVLAGGLPNAAMVARIKDSAQSCYALRRRWSSRRSSCAWAPTRS